MLKFRQKCYLSIVKGELSVLTKQSFIMKLSIELETALEISEDVRMGYASQDELEAACAVLTPKELEQFDAMTA